jgi:hypothetical protein
LTKTATKDPDLVRVLEAWPELPTAIKAAVLALVSMAEGPRG